MTDVQEAPTPVDAEVGTVDAVIVGRRVRRALHAAQAARARLLRHRLRGRRWCRRHVVLEPLPGCSLRRREHQLLVLVRPRARAGVGLDRALRHPARDPSLRQPRRRPLRPAPRHPVQDACRVGLVRRGRAAVARAHRPGRPRLGPARDHGGRLPVDVEDAGDPGRRGLPGQLVPHRSLAARGRRLHRAACGGHRHRVVGDPVDPDVRRAGGAADGVPAHAELQPAGEERPARPADDGRAQGALPAAPPGGSRERLRRPQPGAREVGARGDRRRSARPRTTTASRPGASSGCCSPTTT